MTKEERHRLILRYKQATGKSITQSYIDYYRMDEFTYRLNLLMVLYHSQNNSLTFLDNLDYDKEGYKWDIK